MNNFRDNIAAISAPSQITYSEMTENAPLLLSKIPNRCLVFNLSSNVIGALFGYVSFLNSNIVQLMLGEDLDNELLNHLIELYHPSYLWIPSKKISEFNYEVVVELYDYALVKTELHPYPMHEELALLLTTSGSTGSPKLVRQSYKNIKSNAESIVKYLEISELERPITTLPMNYTYGLSIINSHLLKGATILLTNKSFMEKEFWDFFKEYDATSFGGVPYTYEMLHRLRFTRMNLPSLTNFTQAGGKLIPELHKEFAEFAEKKGLRFYVMYGQTEATARMSYLPYQKAVEKCGSMGIAIPSGDLLLIDTNGQIIDKSNVVGEIVYHGPNVTLGYAECGEDLNKGDERHGILETGDMAIRDNDGYYYIVGRKKRFLKIFGNRVNLDECERMVKSEFDIPCACIGHDDSMQIYLTNSVLVDTVRKFLSEKTGLNHIAFNVRCIAEIPTNDSGKTLYEALPK